MANRDPNPRFEALIIPDEAVVRGGVEVLRAAIIDGQLHVTLRRTFEEPDPWGGLLSEVVRRVARAYTVDGKMQESEVVFRIHSTFVSEGGVHPARAKKAAKKPAKKRGSRGRR